MTKRKPRMPLLDDLDTRYATPKKIKQRIMQLEQDAGADTVQKRMLVRRVVNLEMRIEAMEAAFAQGTTEGNTGTYVQMINLLRCLLVELGATTAKEGRQPELADILAGASK